MQQAIKKYRSLETLQGRGYQNVGFDPSFWKKEREREGEKGLGEFGGLGGEKRLWFCRPNNLIFPNNKAAGRRGWNGTPLEKYHPFPALSIIAMKGGAVKRSVLSLLIIQPDAPRSWNAEQCSVSIGFRLRSIH